MNGSPRIATWVKLALAVLALGAGVWLAAREIHFGDGLAQCVEFFRRMGPLAFFGAMALLPVLGFPMAPFTLVAGPVFGPVLGVGNVILCTLLAVTINVALSYWIAARALRPLVERCVRRLGRALPTIQPHAAWTFIMVIRVVPGTPFFLQSYLLGLARVPFGLYMIISTLVPAAYLSATILFGDALMRGDRMAMTGAAVLFVVAGGILHQIRRRFGRKPSETAPDVNPEP